MGCKESPGTSTPPKVLGPKRQMVKRHLTRVEANRAAPSSPETGVTCSSWLVFLGKPTPASQCFEKHQSRARDPQDRRGGNYGLEQGDGELPMASDWIFLFLKKWDSEPSRSTRLGCNGLTYLHNFQSVVPTKQLKDTGRQWASSKGHGNSRLFIGDPAFQKRRSLCQSKPRG